MGIEGIPGYIPEIVVGLVLAVFGWAFKSWSATIKDTSNRILERLEKLASEFHHHRIETERRVTRVETKVDSLRESEEGGP